MVYMSKLQPHKVSFWTDGDLQSTPDVKNNLLQ